MARPKKYHEARDSFTMFIPQTLNEVIDEKCHRERKNKCEYFIDLAIHDVGVQESTSIGVIYDPSKYIQQPMEEQQEPKIDHIANARASLTAISKDTIPDAKTTEEIEIIQKALFALQTQIPGIIGETKTKHNELHRQSIIQRNKMSEIIHELE